jgi:hypothetical protein
MDQSTLAGGIRVVGGSLSIRLSTKGGSTHMKERSLQLITETEENLGCLSENISSLSQYIGELEGLIEEYRTFLSQAQFIGKDDMAGSFTLLARTQDLVGPPLRQLSSSDS